MNVGNACPECGSLLLEDAPGGLCPECLIRQGLSPIEPEDPDRTTPSAASFIPPSPAKLAPHFPQLEIIKLLGHGGMGAVYKARQIKLDRWIALKIIHPETARDASFAERFTREARTLARLNHPGIVGVHDFGEISEGVEPDQGPVYFFLMEYVDGVNLRELIAEQSLAANQTLALVPQVCEALQYAHDRGVVHRDIKPENILVDRQGTVKIADFGLARLVESSSHEYTLTASHQVMGTPRYMSPEQMAGSHGVDHRADIYSLGVVFYELLTGEVPMGQFEPPSRRADTDARLDEVVMRALAREPERRFQSASEMKLGVDAATSGDAQVHDLIAGSPQAPQGMSSIVEREVAAAWRWVSGEPDPWTKKQELPALLMFVIAVAGCLVVMLPWIEYRIDESSESRQARAAVVATSDSEPLQPTVEFPITHSLKGTDFSGPCLAAVVFVVIALLILATPREMRRSVFWSLAITLLAGVALVGVLAYQVEAWQYQFTKPDFRNGQWTQQTVRASELVDSSWQIGFYAALGLAIAELVFGATGIRHAIASRARASAKRQNFADGASELTQPRFSRKAIIGAVWASIFFVGIPIVLTPAMVVYPSPDGPNNRQVMLVMLTGLLISLPILAAPIGTTILGVVALGEIRSSQGRIVGLGLAFLDAVLFPTLLLGSVAVASACLLSWPSERVVAGVCSAGICLVVTIGVWAMLWRHLIRTSPANLTDAASPLAAEA